MITHYHVPERHKLTINSHFQTKYFPKQMAEALVETTSELSNLTLRGSGPSQYVKLNVGGSLHYTTIATLTKHDNMLRAMFSGRMEVLTDADGWILIGRNVL